MIGLIAVLFCAAPNAAIAAPPLRALIVDGQNYHNWQQTTPVLKKLLEETGLFSVDVATSPPHGQDIEPLSARLRAYNVVVMNYHGDDWPAATQGALERYMAEGGGLVIVHGASLNFPQWKAFNEMIGLGAWANRTEKNGPYVYWKDGQIVRDTTPGPCGFHARGAAVHFGDP